MLIPLLNSPLSAIIDDSFAYLSQFQWRELHCPPAKTIYAAATIDRKLVRLHRLILGISDPKIRIDHHDGTGLNNTLDNLRIASPSQNTANTPRLSTNTSGFKGVYWCQEKKKWRAQIVFNNKTRSLGRFADPVAAAKTYDTHALVCFGEFALLNFPTDSRQSPSQDAPLIRLDRGNSVRRASRALLNRGGVFPARSVIASLPSALPAPPVKGESPSDGQHLTSPSIC